MGGNFNVSQPVQLQGMNDRQVITVGSSQTGSDDLTGVPII
jgi:hypothetical protein